MTTPPINNYDKEFQQVRKILEHPDPNPKILRDVANFLDTVRNRDPQNKTITELFILLKNRVDEIH